MKKISLAIFALLILASCANEHPKNYISLSGKLENNKDSIITISGRTGDIKTISIKEDGSLYLVNISNMPWARPDISSLPAKLVFAEEKNYPVRGNKWSK